MLMNHHNDGCDLPLEQRLKGMRACLAFIREEALAYGQDDVADHLALACHILDVNTGHTSHLPRNTTIDRRLS